MSYAEHHSQPSPKKYLKGYKAGRLHHRTWGPKLGRMVDTYSEPAWVLQLMLEANLDVRMYCEKYPTVDEFINGKRLRHTFTFWVQYFGGSEELIDVPDKRELISNAVGDPEPRRWQDIQEWCIQNDYQCRFILKHSPELKNNALIDNWQQILPHLQSGYEKRNTDLEQRLHGAILAREVRMSTELTQRFPKEDPVKLFQSLFILLHIGKVHIDLSTQDINECFDIEVPHENSDITQ